MASLCAGLVIGLAPALAQVPAPAPAPFSGDGRAAAQEVARAAAPPAAFKEKLGTADTVRQLRSGGFVMYMRHGQTDNDRVDMLPVNLADCKTQRGLTDAGRLTTKRVGEAIRRARIPVHEVRSSPMCRTMDSAESAFPGIAVINDRNLMYVANYTDAEKAPILANTRRWLSEPPAAGSNRVLVGHAPNLMDLIGYFPKEATIVVFRPLGGQRFQYEASIPADQWSRLSAP